MNMTISYSRLRDTLKNTCDQVCDEHEPILVKRQNGEDVVLVSAEDYSSLIETAYLMRSPANAERLLAAMNRDRSEQITFKDVNELRNAIGI
ncbi:MAG TPA: type II toxin-antitoxin system prevent-host-death family antitoxin [Gammaproteobacteria bacterium]|nr:type II toxin-antitoxin system prevent-host-death family antitoxin [Gammaproteobacteria bacterium]